MTKIHFEQLKGYNESINAIYNWNPSTYREKFADDIPEDLMEQWCKFAEEKEKLRVITKKYGIEF